MGALLLPISEAEPHMTVSLARVLIEIVGAEHQTGTDILITSGAILLLSFAVIA
jgi:phosphate starvation-inducible membrane PsiE